MLRMPRISILMPVYNGMPYITEAIESVLAQEEQSWELIISDDGSSDNTRKYLANLSDPRVHIHFQTQNLGIFGNLNFLITKAQSPIAKIFCQDDKMLPEALTRIADFMEQRPSCAVSRCLGVGDNNRFAPGSRHYLEGTLPTRLEPDAALLAFATFGNLVGNLTKATFRPNLVLLAGGFNQEYPYAGDFETWSRVISRYGIDLQNEELVFVRSHDKQNSILLNRNNELYPQINKILLNFSEHVDPIDLATLKCHWTVHFFSTRLPRFVRQLFRGQFKSAFNIWRNLPFGITILECIIAYPHRKFDTKIAHKTTRVLFKRITEINYEKQ